MDNDDLMTFEDDCKLLGLDAGCTLDELSAARRRKAAQWHPDRLEGMAPELKEYAGRQLARINAAYERLERRAQSPKARVGSLQAEIVHITQMMAEFDAEMSAAIADSWRCSTCSVSETRRS